MSAGKLLAVFAHPDDETFICGGTLAHYAQHGVEITLVCATKGEMGRRMGNPPFITRETMPFVRESELREACQIIGIRNLIFLDLRDKTVEFADPESLMQRIVEIIQRVKPDVMLTFHEQWGGHPDHCAIGKAAAAAFHFFKDNENSIQTKASRSLPHLYFISLGEQMKTSHASFGVTREQVMRIDISDSLSLKVHAFRAHRSQTECLDWLWADDHETASRFLPEEYLVQGDAKPRRSGMHDLFEEEEEADCT